MTAYKGERQPLSIRLPKSLKAWLDLVCRDRKIKLNDYLVELIQDEAGREEPAMAPYLDPAEFDTRVLHQFPSADDKGFVLEFADALGVRTSGDLGYYTFTREQLLRFAATYKAMPAKGYEDKDIIVHHGG